MFEKDQTVWDTHMVDVGYNLAQQTLTKVLDDMFYLSEADRAHILKTMDYYKAQEIVDFKKKYLHIEDKENEDIR